MRRLKAGSAGIAVAALALTLAACGSDGGDSDSNNDSEADSGSTELSAELTWWDTSDPDNEAPAYDELIAKFNEEYPDITIDHQIVPFDQTQNKFKTAAEADSGAPDILRAEVAWTPEFASLGYLYALDGTAALENNFLETPLSSNEFDGKTYGVPQVTDTLGLMYNKELFEKAGLDPEAPPTTWDEVREAAAALKSEAGVDGIYLNSGGYFLLPFMYGEGADIVDTESQTITVNSPEAVTGIETAQSLVEDGSAVKPTANDPYGTMMTLFKEQKVGMIINGPWEVAGISDDPKFGGIENLGVAPVPAGGAGQGAPVGGHNYVVYSGMDDQKAEAAAAFIAFMSSAESEAFIADELGLLPGNADSYDMVSNERVALWADAMEVAQPRPWIPEGGQFFAALDTMATEVLIQDKPVQGALDKAADTYKSDVVPDYSLQ
ncbi:extracellular solute-binding protein [Nocardioides sp. zg-1308]|uniref:Extracellular solute-binding protein n=1 Tax=Nocardioides renjunii TaxID=3095075 RepID=A0ABU5K9B3_9ACTN|nr:MULTISPECIES: extracellular solute-binding protein [unclassified Nocardioides]MDZ5661558.1 extracellular solute-binding protein [Nocardioides sp. S-58]NPD04664.1 extracellular solute-binding protein [Nocardioides sp. zg-1308]WQQ22556.1 extracellular solute-binding protein [Nocardioides sp. S-34]